MAKLNYPYSLALLLGICVAIVAYAMPVFPYTPDSACYIEQARSFMARGVFESGYYGTLDPTASYVPDPLFPPGYPLLIVLFSWLLPVPPEVVALFLSLAALALIPAAMLFSFRQLLGDNTVLVISALLMTTPIVIRWGNVASTDVMSVLLVIYCMGLVLKAESLKHWGIIGLLTGFAYLLRNANLAFIISIAGWFAWTLLFEANQRRHRLYCASVWLASFALLVLPWMFRNWLVFGKIQPYSMPPSTIGVVENIHAFIEAQLTVLMPLVAVDGFLARNLFGLLILLSVIALLVVRVLKTWSLWPKLDQYALLISTAYCLLGAAIVVAARSKYQWGELIGERHGLPYLFSLLVLLAVIFKNANLAFNKYWLSVPLLAILFGTRLLALPELYAKVFYHVNAVAVVGQINQHRDTDTLCSHLDGRLGVSNYAFVYRVLCGVPARHIFPILHGNDFNDLPIQELLNLGVTKGMVVSIFPNHDVDKTELPLKQPLIDRLTAAGWHIEKNEAMGFVLTR